ncbi:hypothetical protein [Spirulina sp. 06S082]|uniref:hypothetical protein n=1 Tax=Spirulina sp. 06S082 TaxID=3110248 RepID=UPI002B1F1B66|nr:hypothetical protein [Spirulina sp. 06S082]MEA5471780.1 hypothetical protein [Spirulina sp. 06S082]
MKTKLFLGFLAFVAVWVSSAIALAIAHTDIGVSLYANSEMSLFLGGIIYLLVFEVLIWGIQKTIPGENRFLQWFWLIPILLWSPIHLWLLLLFSSY